jgi:hypothetical protein
MDEVGHGPIKLDYYGIGRMTGKEDPYALHPKHDFISACFKKSVINENQIGTRSNAIASVGVGNRNVVVTDGEKKSNDSDLEDLALENSKSESLHTENASSGDFK